MTDNFVVIHGITSVDLAKGIVSILKEFKEYKVPNPAIVISTENYTVVQIKKNLNDYIEGKIEDNPAQPNWDGTLEKAPEPKQPKEQPKQEVKDEQPEEGGDDIRNNKMPQSIENRTPNQNKAAQQKAMGLPPAPQMGQPNPNKKG